MPARTVLAVFGYHEVLHALPRPRCSAAIAFSVLPGASD
jgi:hypothetical protein